MRVRCTSRMDASVSEGGGHATRTRARKFLPRDHHKGVLVAALAVITLVRRRLRRGPRVGQNRGLVPDTRHPTNRRSCLRLLSLPDQRPGHGRCRAVRRGTAKSKLANRTSAVQICVNDVGFINRCVHSCPAGTPPGRDRRVASCRRGRNCTRATLSFATFRTSDVPPRWPDSVFSPRGNCAPRGVCCRGRNGAAGDLGNDLHRPIHLHGGRADRTSLSRSPPITPELEFTVTLEVRP